MEIRQVLVVKAARDKVWAALTTAEGWTSWFSDGVEGEFQPGTQLRLDFGKDGICWAMVVERVEGESFAVKWHPGEDCPIDKYPESEMTTIRFAIRDVPEGVEVEMVESGFDNVPEARRARCVQLNTEGWAYEMDELRLWLNEGIRQGRASV